MKSWFGINMRQDLFDRSKQVESTGGTGGATSTKLREFFKR